jgi:hypothetical protein
MSKYLYALACVVCLGGGAYAWKVKHAGLLATVQDEPADTDGAAAAAAADASRLAANAPSAVVVEVAGEKVTQEDIDWEYDLLTLGLKNKDELTPIPDLGSRVDTELQPLRKQLAATLIERKLLFAYIKQDKEFVVDEPGRFTACMAELQQSLRDNPAIAQVRDGKARLRARLCERSVLEQYVKERLFPSLRVAEAEVVEYYKNHVGEFKQPDRIEIRQVLLPDENSAKHVRNTINAQNFAELARSKSIAPEAVDGGKLGPFSRRTLPSLFDMAQTMRKGEISPILKTPYGYHIIMLLEKYPKEDMSLDAARPKITAAIRRKKEEDEYQRWVERALASVAVNVPKPLW